jgi:hypothetical protein
MSTKRVFFALWPDDRQRDRLRNAISPFARQIEGTAVFATSPASTTADR